MMIMKKIVINKQEMYILNGGFLWLVMVSEWYDDSRKDLKLEMRIYIFKVLYRSFI